MGNNKTKQTTVGSSNTVQNSNTTTPGTGFGTDVLNATHGNIGVWTTPTSFQGQRYATPASFTPQTQTNAQEGIDAGMASTAQTQAGQAPAVGNLQNYWNTVTSGYAQNPWMNDVIHGWTTDFNEQQQRNRNAAALEAGAQGAYGGTPYQQARTWADDQANQTYANTVANMRYQDYLNWQQLMNQAPEQLSNIAQVNNLPAELLSYWGGQRNQNAREAADRETQIQQSNLDNEYVKWLSGQEGIDTAIARGQGLVGMAAGVPGQTSSGTQNTNSTQTTTTQQSTNPWQIAASLGGAALGMFAPGGLFAASSAFKVPSLLGAGGSMSMTPQTQLPAVQPLAPPVNWLGR